MQEKETSCSQYDEVKAANLIKILKKKYPEFFEKYIIKEYMGNMGSRINSMEFKALSKKRNITVTLIIKLKREEEEDEEIKILKRLKNENIIQLYEICEIDEKEEKKKLFFIVTECPKFGDLISFRNCFFRTEGLSEQFLCFISFQILNALKYFQKCKIVHLDIKPQNIVIDDYLIIKITDFSLSFDYSKIKSNYIKLPFRGTCYYTAPEIIQRKEIQVNNLNKVDLYSLGVTLYHLAFHKYPYELNFDDSNNMEIIKENDNINRCYSPYFIDFITKLLERDINKRMDINEAMNHYWIKGAQILLDEKENTYDNDCFLRHLITNYIMNFNRYLNKK